MKRALLAIALVACGNKADEPPRGVPAPEPKRAPAPESNGGARQRLFADDVARDKLALSISIETLGGISTVLLPRETPLPASVTETFSTSADDQPSVEVHVLQGERPLAVDNFSLGKFQLLGIPPAPRGVPQIDVTFAVDAAGELSVTARDRATGATKAIHIVGGGDTALTKATIERMLREADAARTSDKQRFDEVTARIELENIAYGTRTLLAESGAKASAKVRVACQQALAVADEALRTRTVDLARMRTVTEQLRTAQDALSAEIAGLVR